jgi:hypothetical protein
MLYAEKRRAMAMTTVNIDLPDEAAELKAKLAAQGLSLEGWFKNLADEEAPTHQLNRARAVARIREIQRRSQPDPKGWAIKDYINHGRP